MDITLLIRALFLVLSFIYTVVLVPYIKSKTTEEQYSKLKFYVKTGVQAAEMIYNEPGMGAIKKDYVLNYIRGLGFTVDVNELNALIESAVLELKNSLE